MAVFWLHAFASIFAVMNPVANVPIFLALTAGESGAGQRATARKSALIALMIVLFFALAGQIIFRILGISLNAFRVAGGILLFFIAFNLLQGRPSHVHHPTREEHAEQLNKEDVSVTPLATPILAGPGTISTVLALDGSYQNYWAGTAMTFTAFAAVLLITLILFLNAPRVKELLPQATINLITRMMGLLLTVIAVQMAAAGLTGLFPGLS
ncbi:MarC family protein [Desulfotomaculum copahuensis]|nr:MarC family protein [Desulfotomaculum copahuensis]